MLRILCMSLLLVGGCASTRQWSPEEILQRWNAPLVDGTTRRTDIEAFYGPAGVCVGQRTVCGYRLTPDPVGMPVAAPAHASYELVVVYSESGVLLRHSLVHRER